MDALEPFWQLDGPLSNLLYFKLNSNQYIIFLNRIHRIHWNFDGSFEKPHVSTMDCELNSEGCLASGVAGYSQLRNLQLREIICN
jgi:hypothetical protein